MTDIRAKAKLEVTFAFNEVITRAKYKYPAVAHHLDALELSFRTSGRSAGKAEWRLWKGEYDSGTVRINIGLMVMNPKNWEHVLLVTIPHEIAHIIDAAQRGTSDHSDHWRKIDLSLGGTGKQFHDCAVKKPVRYVYIVAGREVHMTGVAHNRIQRGSHTYRYRGTDMRPTDFAYKTGGAANTAAMDLADAPEL